MEKTDHGHPIPANAFQEPSLILPATQFRTFFRILLSGTPWLGISNEASAGRNGHSPIKSRRGCGESDVLANQIRTIFEPGQGQRKASFACQTHLAAKT